MTSAAFFRLHSWLGIVTGVFVLVIAWSGSLAVFSDEIEWLVNPAARADPALGVRPLDDVAAAIETRYPDRRFAIHRQIGPRWAHIAYVYEGRSQRFLLVDPATAAIRADHVMTGYTFNTGYFLRQLHVRLLMGFWGRVFVGVFGVTLVLSVLTSLWIYREWLQSLLRLRRGHGRRIFHMDLHKAVGLWALAFNLLFGVSGAVLGLENLYFRVKPPAPRAPATFAAAPVLASPITADAAVARVTARHPRFRPTSVEVPPDGPIVVRGDHPSVFIAKGASEYAVHRRTGMVHTVIDARRAPRPEFLYNLLDPLHFGYFGERLGLVTGYLVEAVWAAVGLVPGILGITGGVMWLERQRRQSPRRATLLVAVLAVLVVTGPAAADERAAAVQPPPPRDSLRNGVLIGAGVGFAAGFLTLAAVNAAKTDSGPIWDGDALGYYTTAGIAGAAIGAGLGAVVDAFRRHVTGARPPRSWDAVPLLGPRRGIAVVIRRGSS